MFMIMDEVGNFTTKDDDKTRHGAPSYAGNYRMAYLANGERFLEKRHKNGWIRIINRPIPKHIRGCYAAANYLGV